MEKQVFTVWIVEAKNVERWECRDDGEEDQEVMMFW